MINISVNNPTLRTTRAWCRYGAKVYGQVRHCHSWKTGMRKFAREHGQAICMRADDSAIIVQLDDSRKCGFRVQTIPADRVRWIYV